MAKRQKMSALQLEDLPDEMIVKVKNFRKPEIFSFSLGLRKFVMEVAADKPRPLLYTQSVLIRNTAKSH